MENKGRWVSPNEIQQGAIDFMLKGQQPKTETQWALCVNFWAKNIASGLEVSACRLLAKILDCPLTEKEVVDIAMFQAKRKENDNG